MVEMLGALLQHLLTWLAADAWRPFVGMIVGAAAVLAVGFILARRARRSARGAFGTAWMVGAMALATIFLTAYLIDLAATGHPSTPPGQHFLEHQLFGWFPGASWALPLSDRPVVGLFVYQMVLTPIFLGIVALIGWSLQSGAHLQAHDKAQTAHWLHSLTGRSPEGRLEPGFVSWFRPLLLALGTLLAIAALQSVFEYYQPHPAAWVTAQLFVTGCLVNLRAGDPESESPASLRESSDPPADATSGTPATPSLDSVLAQLKDLGMNAHPSDDGALPASPARYDESALVGSHRALSDFLTDVALPHAPLAFQAELLRRARVGASTLLVGPASAGRTTALGLVGLDAALTRWESVLVITPNPASAVRFAARFRDSLSRGPTPDLVRVAAGHLELASERMEGHDPTIFVTTPEELRGALLAKDFLRAGFFRGLRAILVDDLGRMTAADLAALRLALEELRLLVHTQRGDSDAGLTVIAATLPWSAGIESWAASIVGTQLRSLVADGAPYPASDVVLVAPDTPAAQLSGPRSVLETLSSAGFRVRVFDEIHAAYDGFPSLAPYPIWELPTDSEQTATLADETGASATLVLTRRADLRLAIARRRAMAASGAGTAHLLALYVVDAAVLPASVHLTSLAATEGAPSQSPKPLRLAPPAHRIASVERQHLVATLVGDRHDLDWLRRVFAPDDVDALAKLADRAGVLESGRRIVLDGRPASGFVERPSAGLTAEPDFSDAPGWARAPQVEVRSDPDDGLLCSVDTHVANTLLHPRACIAVDGRRWRLGGETKHPDGAARARHEPSSYVVRRLARTAVASISTLRADQLVSFRVGTPALAVGVHAVHLTERVTGYEELEPTGELQTREGFAETLEFALLTHAVRIHIPGLVADESASLALAIAARAALCAIVALDESALEIAVEAAPGAAVPGVTVWMTERRPSGGALAAWLMDDVVKGRWFWQVLQEVLRQGPKPAWRLLRTDDLDIEPTASIVYASLQALTGLSGVNEPIPAPIEPAQSQGSSDV